jgi:tetratricopeptide (TPR) repeat protein
MNVLRIAVTLFLVVVFFIGGCATTSNQKTPSTFGRPIIERPENRYYYFTEAEIQIKKGNLAKAIELLKKAIEMDPDSLYLKRELATVYLRNKDDENAINVLEGIINEHPTDVRSLIIYGGIKQVHKDTPAAIDAYEKVIAEDPKQKKVYALQKKVYALLGGLYIEAGKLDQAKRVFDQMIENFPGTYVGHFYLGKIYVKQGKLKEAEKEFKRTLEIEPELLEPRYELLELYKDQKNTQEALKIYKDILKRNPSNIRAAMELGYYYYSHGKVAQAEEIFKKLGQRSVAEFEVIIKIIQLYLDKKKYDEGLVILQGMLKAVPDSPEIHHVAGIAFYGKKDNPSALKHFMKVTPESRFYEDAVIHASYILSDNKQDEEAIKLLSEAIKNEPQNAEFKYYLGTFYEDSEQLDKAAKLIRAAIELDPDNPRYYFRLGVVYDKWNKKEDSMATMRKVIELDPKHANALNYLGYTYADLGTNLDEAEQLIKEALKYKPNDGYITDSLGWVYYKKGEFEIALQYLQKAVQMVPDDPIMLEHLGDAYFKLNDKTNALKYYKKSLKHKDKDKEELEKKIRTISPDGS